MGSGISYCTDTWEVVTGCPPDEHNEVCRKRCWAARMQRQRAATHGGMRHSGEVEMLSTRDRTDALRLSEPVPFSELVLHPGRLEQPLHWRRPRVVFVASRGDLFHERVPDEYIFGVCDVIAKAPQHRYLLLTKRWERMVRMVLPMLGHLRANGDPVWWGFTAWDGDSAKRVTKIVANHFFQSDHVWLSLEPLLGPVSLGADAGFFNFIVAGCESGGDRRPAPRVWFDDLREQCREAEVPFYLKQHSREDDGTGRVLHPDPLPGELPWRLRSG